MNRLQQISWRRLLSGLFRRARKENDALVQRLAMLRADYNQLRQDTHVLLNQADRDMEALRETNAGLAKEFDDLQLRVWELEQQVKELLLYIARVMGTADSNEAAGEAVPNLSWVRLALVGGHPATQREVINELALIHGLQRWVIVPPSRECSFKKAVLKGKLEGCDLIVIITGYMNHSLTQAVFGLKNSGALKGKVVLLNFRGKTGVVSEVLRQVALLK